MVLYFSATGNSKYIATLLGNKLSTKVVNLLPYVKKNKLLVVDDPSTIIICVPIYICNIPTFLIKYLKTIKFTHAKNCYFVLTNGGYDGIGKHYAKKIARAWKLNYKGSLSVKMPRNYIANNHYPELSKEEILSRIQNATNSINSVITSISNLEKLKHRHVFLFEYLITFPFIPIYSRTKLTTKDFYINEKCVDVRSALITVRLMLLKWLIKNQCRKKTTALIV